MSLFDSASLVVTPNGYKAGKLYSIKPTSGAGDLDVVRATSATRVNASGVIEIPRTNLLLRSEEFEDAAWSKTAGVVVTSNSEISPNGTLTADTINFGASNRIVSQSTTLATGVIATGSVYIKGISGQTIQLAVGGVDVLFTLNGNWQKLEATRTSITSVFNLNTFGGATARIISVWGAQLELGNVATEYIPTTSVIRTRFAGITQDGGSANNIPRLDYTNASCPSILVEPQRTNLLLRSEEFDNASWLKSAVTISANSTTSPDGTNNADKFIPSVDNSSHQIRQIGFTSSAYTFSVYAKAGEETTFSLWLRSASVFAMFDLINGTITSKSASVVATITNVGNGWFRCTAYDPTAGTTAQIYGRNGSAFIGNGTDGFYLWGAQLEAGANATSYIPTQASTVTRNADVISKTGVSSLIGQTEGTIYAEIDINTIETKGILDISADVGNFYRIRTASNGQFLFRYRTGGGAETTIASLSASNSQTGIFKIAFAYKNGDYASCVNGVLRTSNISGISPIGSISEVFIGVNPLSLNDRVNSVMIFKERLTNEQCIALTTL